MKDNNDDMFLDEDSYYEEPMLERQKPNYSKLFKEIFSYLKVIMLALIFTKVILPLFILVVYIPSGSMIPTLQVKDEVLTVNKFWEPLNRGDIIVFKPTREQMQNEGTNEYFIKRLIGMPGDRVEIKEGKVYVNEKLLNESYTNGKFDYTGTFIVPKERYLVLGDNREISYDGRYWTNPFIKESQIVSVAKFVILPFKHINNVSSN